MTTATAARPTSTVKEIPLKSICANSGQTRGFGVCPQLLSLGYGVFEKTSVDAEKSPIWTLLTSADPEERKHAVSLIREHEPDIVNAAESREKWGQFQNPCVIALDDETYDVAFGMTRCLAAAFLHASDPKDNPSTIEVSVMDKAMSELDLLMMGFEENNARREESPIDKAMFFAKLKKDHKMETKDIAERFGYSKQAITDYIKLLNTKIEDLRMKVHDGEMGMYKALKILEKRKESGGEDGDDDSAEGAASGDRARLPSAKKMMVAYGAKKKPEWMEQKEWEMVIKEDVRKWLAFRLGKRFSPFTGEVLTVVEEKPKNGKAETNGDAKIFKYTITKLTAIKLLTALGKPEAADWKDETIESKLMNIVNLAEPGTTLEDEKLNKILQLLMSKYATGLSVKLKQADK